MIYCYDFVVYMSCYKYCGMGQLIDKRGWRDCINYFGDMLKASNSAYSSILYVKKGETM